VAVLGLGLVVAMTALGRLVTGAGGMRGPARMCALGPLGTRHHPAEVPPGGALVRGVSPMRPMCPHRADGRAQSTTMRGAMARRHVGADVGHADDAGGLSRTRRVGLPERPADAEDDSAERYQAGDGA
jgi:hypothetical protein